MVARGPQNGQRGLEMGLTQVIGNFEPLSLNKFFDPSTPSMRKGRDRENGMEWGKHLASNALNASNSTNQP